MSWDFTATTLLNEVNGLNCSDKLKAEIKDFVKKYIDEGYQVSSDLAWTELFCCCSRCMKKDFEYGVAAKQPNESNSDAVIKKWAEDCQNIECKKYAALKASGEMKCDDDDDDDW
jgi:hypothetical protein